MITPPELQSSPKRKYSNLKLLFNTFGIDQDEFLMFRKLARPCAPFIHQEVVDATSLYPNSPRKEILRKTICTLILTL